MTTNFIIIPAATMAVGLMAWSFVDGRHPLRPVNTEAARIVADDPALKHYSEDSPYMRSER